MTAKPREYSDFNSNDSCGGFSPLFPITNTKVPTVAPYSIVFIVYYKFITMSRGTVKNPINML